MSGRIVRSEPTGAKLPLLGKIKIGDKAINKNGKEYPISLDHFRATGKYESFFLDAYGDKPNKIQIIFISDNFKDVCDEHYEIRDNAGRLTAEGDGENWKAYNPITDKYEYNVKATVEELEKKFKAEAKINLTIRFILPKIPGVFGQWSFNTKGHLSSIPQIRDTFDQVQTMAGSIINIPFDLVVEKVKSQKPGSSNAFPVVSLIPNISQGNLDILAEFVHSGQKLRGILSDDRIQQLVSNNIQLSLPSHTEVEIIGTAEVLEEIGITISKEQIEELRKAVHDAGFKTKPKWEAYLQTKGFTKTDDILVDNYKEILNQVKSGEAMKIVNPPIIPKEITAEEERALINGAE